MENYNVSGVISHISENCPKEDGWCSMFVYSDIYGEILITGYVKTKIYEGMRFRAVAASRSIYYSKRLRTNDYKYDFGTSFYLEAESERNVMRYMRATGNMLLSDDILKDIYNKHGYESFKILAEKPEILIDYGMDYDTIERFYKHYCYYSPFLEDIYIGRLKNFFSTLGLMSLVIDTAFCRRLVDKYHDKVMTVITDNPYIISYRGFNKDINICDNIAIALARTKEIFESKYGVKRKIAYISHVLFKESVNGNTVLCLGNACGNSNHSYVDLSAYSCEFLNAVNIAIQNSIHQVHIGSSGYITGDEFFDLLEIGSKDSVNTGFYLDKSDCLRLCDASLRHAESLFTDAIIKAANRNSRLLKTPSVIKAQITKYENMKNCKFDNDQKQAIINALTKSVSVITGGPGSGKTTVIQCILYLWKHYTKKEEIMKPVLTAPTGKAVSRMREIIGSDMLKDCYIGTVAHFNYMSAVTSDVFKACIKNGIIIIDEASMLDIIQAGYFLDNYAACVNIVIIGDVNQLPSIGPGALLRDICNSDYAAKTELKKCYRTAGAKLIAECAECINMNDTLGVRNALVKDTRSVCYLPHYNNKFSEIALDFYQRCINRGFQENQICIIVPNNSLVNDINDVFHDKFNPESVIPSQAGYPLPCNKKLRISSRVICTENHKLADKDIEPLNKEAVNSSGIMNGDCGYILDYVDIADNRTKDNGYAVFYADTGAEYKIYYNGRNEDSSLKDFRLAYCITAHKSQGSEYEAVMVALPSGMKYWGTPQGSFATKNWLYTAVTRARKYVCITGSSDSFEYCISNNGIGRRTFLQDWL